MKRRQRRVTHLPTTDTEAKRDDDHSAKKLSPLPFPFPQSQRIVKNSAHRVQTRYLVAQVGILINLQPSLIYVGGVHRL